MATKQEIAQKNEELTAKVADLTVLVDSHRATIASLEADKATLKIELAEAEKMPPAPTGKPEKPGKAGKRIKIHYLDDIEFHGTIAELVPFLKANPHKQIGTVELMD